MVFRRSDQDAAGTPEPDETPDNANDAVVEAEYEQTHVAEPADNEAPAAEPAAADEPEVAEPAADEVVSAETDVAGEPTAEGLAEPTDPDAAGAESDAATAVMAAVEPAAQEPAAQEPDEPEPDAREHEADEPESEEPDVVVDPSDESLQETAVHLPITAVDPEIAVDPEPTVVLASTFGEVEGTDDPAGTDTGAEAGAVADPAPAAAPPRRGRRRKVVIGVVAGLILVCGGYAAAAWYFSDKVPQNTTVAGVDLSGMSVPDAEAALNTQLADLVVAPISVEVGETSTTIDPGGAGLQLDAAATVASFTGFSLQPQHVFGHLFGLGVAEPVLRVDGDALDEAVTAAAVVLDVAPVDGAIAFTDGQATIATEPRDGSSLDVDASADLLRQQWLTGERPFVLPAETTTPAIDDEVIAAAMSDIVEPMLSGPVTVVLNEAEYALTPEQLAATAQLRPSGSALELTLDGAALAAEVTAAVPSIGETAQDAQITFEHGEPHIVPAVTGTGLDPEQLATVVAAAAVVTEPAERVATAELASTEPEFSTADAEALGVRAVVGEFSTPYPYDPTRTQNLINGAANINGTLILPGAKFSLIEALGPITLDEGYVSSHVVEDGFVTDAIGGGLSQISTTTFNAAYEAGMEDILHKPHSRWFDRYPAGREATMFAPSLDMQWGNNTPYGVLVQAWVDTAERRVHVRLWSTAYWTVNIDSSGKYNYTSPTTVYNEKDGCEPESAGPRGFTIDITRTVALNGEVNQEYSDSYSWRYAPWNAVVCGPPPEPGEMPTDS